MSEARALVVGVFGDEVRAEQAVRALEVWRRANRAGGVGPIGLVARGVSGTTTWRARGVLRPRRGALFGLLVGVVLLALPAAGAAGLAAWVLGSIVFGLAGLVGAIPSSQTGTLVLMVTAAGAGLAALLTGLVGALIGCLVGLVVGLVDAQVRGLSRSEVARTVAVLGPGTWAAVARSDATAAPMVRDELGRLGGALTIAPEPLAPAPNRQAAASEPAAAAAPEPMPPAPPAPAPAPPGQSPPLHEEDAPVPGTRQR